MGFVNLLGAMISTVDVSESDDDSDIDFDAVAKQAVAAVKVEAPKELGEFTLDTGLRNSHLLLQGKRGKEGFDTRSVPGHWGLDFRDYSECSTPEAPAADSVEREVRGQAVRPVDDKALRKKEAKAQKGEALAKWFGLPRAKMTPELEKELLAIKLRGNVDPKRFYKGQDSKKLPTHFHVAVETGGDGPVAGYHAKNESRRGVSFLDSVLRDSQAQDWTYKKFTEVSAKGDAAANSGHGRKRPKRSEAKGTKRGQAWKKKKH